MGYGLRKGENSFSEELRRQGLNEQAEVIELEVIRANEELSKQLQIGPESLVQRVYRIRRTDYGPYALETSYIPCGIVGEFTKEMINEQGLYRSMEQYGVISSAIPLICSRN